MRTHHAGAARAVTQVIRRWAFAALALSTTSLMASLTACGSDEVTPGPITTEPSEGLQVVNGTAGSVDVRIDGALRVTALSPYTSSPVLTAAAGARNVQLTASGAVSGTAQVTVQVESGSRETVAAIPGSGLPLLAVSLPDTGYIVGTNRSKLRIVHLATNAPPLTIWRTQPDFNTPIAIVTPYAYLSTAIVESAAGSWTVRVWPTASGSWTSAASTITVNIPAGQLRTVATMDAPGGGVQLKIVEP